MNSMGIHNFYTKMSQTGKLVLHEAINYGVILMGIG